MKRMRMMIESRVTGSVKQGEASSIIERSAWHSPVPYLFGGLAAMLGLIAFALLILACSYCRNTNNTNEEEEEEEGEDENMSGTQATKGEGPLRKTKGSTLKEEPNIVVIMAGEDNPSFLATPSTIIFPCTCSSTHSYHHTSSSSSSTTTTTSLPNHHDDDVSKQ